jgi:hypothetical protein
MAPDREDLWLGNNSPLIRITGFRLVPESMGFGQTVDVRVRVKNKGTGKGGDNLRVRAFKIQGALMVTEYSLLAEHFELDPGQERIFSIHWKPQESTFTLTAECSENAETRVLMVGPPVPFGVTAVPVVPPHGAHLRVICIAVGVPIVANASRRLTAIVQNAGDTDGDRKIVTSVTGPSPDFNAEQIVTVPAQEQRCIYWDWQPQQAGTHRWTVEQMSADLTVQAHP